MIDVEVGFRGFVDLVWSLLRVHAGFLFSQVPLLDGISSEHAEMI
jgi:hypothetical protein